MLQDMCVFSDQQKLFSNLTNILQQKKHLKNIENVCRNTF